MSDELTLGSVKARVTDEAIVLTIELVNDTDRTLHAYREARRVQYDEASGTLRVGLTDREASANGTSGSFVLPRMASVDPHGTATIEVRLPRVITRIGGVTAQGAPLIERVPIHEAGEVLIELGWSDTPFYKDPRTAARRKAHPAKQLARWERGLATGRAKMTRPRRRKASD